MKPLRAGPGIGSFDHAGTGTTRWGYMTIPLAMPR
jgi:hypothetical protein